MVRHKDAEQTKASTRELVTKWPRDQHLVTRAFVDQLSCSLLHLLRILYGILLATLALLGRFGSSQNAQKTKASRAGAKATTYFIDQLTAAVFIVVRCFMCSSSDRDDTFLNAEHPDAAQQFTAAVDRIYARL